MNYGQRIKSLEFEVDYVAPIEQQTQEMYLEQREVQRDNTRVAMPKVIFIKN